MKNIFILEQNLDIIRPMLDSFSSLHQLWLKFIGCSGEYILTPQKPQSHFCRLIRSCPEGLKRCRASALRCADFTPNHFHIFNCHAGLTILTVPLQTEYGLIGALATGEIRLNPHWHDNHEIARKTNDLNLDGQELMEAFNGLAVRKKEDVLALADALHSISNCFLKLGTALANGNNITTGSPPYGSPSTTQQSVAYILNNYMKQLSLEQVARHIHLSPAYFSYLFRQEQGQTFSDFLTGVRLKKAEALLKEKPFLSIFEIARQTGYEDANYFSRVFKKMFGLPPSLYRKKGAGRQKTVC